MKTRFSLKGKSSPTHKAMNKRSSKVLSPKEKIQFPKMDVNLKDTFSGMKVGMTGMMNKFNAQFGSHGHSHGHGHGHGQSPQSGSSKSKKATPQPPAKDMKL